VGLGGDLDVDVESWRGFPCNSNLMAKMAFILARPRATVRHIMYGGGQDEPFVPILFIVPLLFFAASALRRMGRPVMSENAARTMLKFGVAIGCRSVILLRSLAHPEKESVYYKRYSKVVSVQRSLAGTAALLWFARRRAIASRAWMVWRWSPILEPLRVGT
jgi:hypothetical protein